MDYSSGNSGQPFTLTLNNWISLFVANLPIADSREDANFLWHRTATGFLDANPHPLSLHFEDVATSSLNDSTLAFHYVGNMGGKASMKMIIREDRRI